MEIAYLYDKDTYEYLGTQSIEVIENGQTKYKMPEYATTIQILPEQEGYKRIWNKTFFQWEYQQI